MSAVIEEELIMKELITDRSASEMAPGIFKKILMICLNSYFPVKVKWVTLLLYLLKLLMFMFELHC